jgi:hypothetical protein
MKKLWIVLILLLCSRRAISQGAGYTQVFGTGKTCYANGSVQATFLNQSTTPQLPLLNGSTFPTTAVTNFNSAGAFSFYLADNQQIFPTPSQWTITACAHSGAQPACGTTTVTATGPTTDITPALTAMSCPSSGGTVPGQTGDVFFNQSGGLATDPGKYTYNPTTGLLTTPAIAAAVVNYENVAQTTSTDPNTLIQQACLTPHPQVTLPAGKYVTQGIPLIPACSSLHVTCATTALTGALAPKATVIQLAATATNPALYNLNANATSGPSSANNVSDIWFEGCVWDGTQNPNQPLAILKGISNARFSGGGAVGNNNAVPLWISDGSNFVNVGGNYYTRYENFKLYDLSSTSSATGVYLTGAVEPVGAAGSNEITYDGGGAFRFGTGVKIDCANGSKFINFSMENSRTYGVWGTTTTSANGTCSGGGNLFIGNRMELPASATGYQFDSGVVQNLVIQPLFSGAFNWFVDANPTLSNTCIGTCFAKVGVNTFVGSWYAKVAPGAYSMGLGMIPGTVGGTFSVNGSPTANMDVMGNIRLNNPVYQYIGQSFGLVGQTVTYWGNSVLWNADSSHNMMNLQTTGHLIFAANTGAGGRYLTSGNPTTQRIISLGDGPSSIVFSATLTSTAAATDNVAIQGALSGSKCGVFPTNAAAASAQVTTPAYISAKTTNQVTVTHAATAGMTYDITCTVN